MKTFFFTVDSLTTVLVSGTIPPILINLRIWRQHLIIMALSVGSFQSLPPRLTFWMSQFLLAQMASTSACMKKLSTCICICRLIPATLQESWRALFMGDFTWLNSSAHPTKTSVVCDPYYISVFFFVVIMHIPSTHFFIRLFKPLQQQNWDIHNQWRRTLSKSSFCMPTTIPKTPNQTKFNPNFTGNLLIALTDQLQKSVINKAIPWILPI